MSWATRFRIRQYLQESLATLSECTFQGLEFWQATLYGLEIMFPVFIRGINALKIPCVFLWNIASFRQCLQCIFSLKKVFNLGPWCQNE